MKSIIKSIGYILFYVLFQSIVISIIAMIVKNSVNDVSQMQNIINSNTLGLAILTNILTILLLSLFFKLHKKRLYKETNIKLVDIKQCLLPCIIAFSASMIFSILTINLNFENENLIQNSVRYYSNIMPFLGIILQIIALLLVSPFTEEIICRGLILTNIQDKYNNVVAIIVSALLFGIIHFMAGGIILVIGSVLMGIIFGFIYVKTKSLLPAIIAHGVANIPDFIMAVLPKLSQSTSICLIVAFFLIFVFSIYNFSRRMDKQQIHEKKN